MAQYSFGSGQLFALSSTSAGVGSAPLRFGALQDVSLDFDGDIKNLHGQYQFPLAVGRGKSKIEGKFAFGAIDPDIYNLLYFNQTVATGHSKQATNESGTIPGTPFAITVANAATFELDLGVFNAVDGSPYKQVASGPTTGQYSVSAVGVYTFAAADTGKAVLLNYLYTVAGTGKKLAISNTLMGAITPFQLVLSETFQGKAVIMRFYQVVVPKLSFPFKMDDFTLQDASFSVQQDDAGRIGYISVSG